MKKSTNLFSKQNNEKATIDAVNTNISETRNANKELRSDIASINSENKEIKFFHNERIDKLKNKHTTSKEFLLKEQEKLNIQLASADKKISTLKASSDKKMSQLEAKKDKLKNTYINKYNDGIEKEYNDSEALRLSYEQQLEELKKQRDQQNEAFNIKAANFDNETNREIISLKQEKNDKTKKIEEIKDSYNQEIKSLEKEIEKNKLSQDEALAKIEIANKEKEAVIIKAQTEKINAKKEELLRLEKDYDALSFKKEQLLKIKEDLKTNNDLEFQRLKTVYDNEISILNSENEKIKNTLSLKKDEETNVRIAAEEKYAKTLAELNELSSILTNKEKTTLANLEEQLKNRSEDFKKQFSEFVENLDQKYLNEKENHEKELQVLKQKVEIEKVEFEKRKTYLLDRYNDRFNQAQQAIGLLKNDNEELENKYTVLSKDYKQKIDDLKNKIKELNDEYLNSLEIKENEYKKKIDEYKTENDAIIETILNSKNAVNDKIDSLNIKIAAIQASIET